MSYPHIVHAGAGPSVDIGGTAVSFLVGNHDTADRFGLTEHRMPPSAPGAPLHYHRTMTEMFYVVDGEVSLTLGSEQHLVGPRTFMLVPEGTPHAFANPGNDPATLLVMFSPDHGREQYFRELGDLLRASPAPDREAVEELARRFDQHPATLPAHR